MNSKISRELKRAFSPSYFEHLMFRKCLVIYFLYLVTFHYSVNFCIGSASSLHGYGSANENIKSRSDVIIELFAKNKESDREGERAGGREEGKGWTRSIGCTPRRETLLFRASFTRDSAAKSTLWSFHGNYVLILRQNTAPIVRNP